MPLISVIVPVYNVEKYLERCIESVLNQTLVDLELVLVDDESTDSSGRICDDYAQNDSRVKVIHQKNKGQGLARNAGIRIAEGKYIAFLDSDDYMEDCAYESITSVMQDTGAQMASFGYCQEYSNGVVAHESLIRDRMYSGEDFRILFLPHFFGDNPADDDLRGVSACMSVFERQIIERYHIEFPSERVVFSEDTIFCLEYCKHIDSAVTLSRRYYHYCLKDDSFSKSYRADRFDRACDFAESLVPYAQHYGITDEVSNRLQMLKWISLMELLKTAVRCCDKYKHEVKKIIEQDNVRELVKEMPTNGIGFRQKMFLYSIRYRLTLGTILLVKLRSKRGI